MNLPEPTITETAGGYIIEFGGLVKINTLSIHQHNDGHVTAEISVYANIQGKEGLQCLRKPTLVNLSSDQTRSRLSHNLDDRYGKDQLDWYKIIEQFSDIVITEFRRGEPIKELLGIGEDGHPPEYILKPLIIKNYPNVIFGDPGAFKSAFSLVLTVLASLPWRDNSLGFEVPQDRQRCLYLDWETDRDTVNWVMSKLEKGMALPTFPLYYRRCSLPLSQDIERIKQAIAEIKADIVIIDSLGLASGDELNNTKTALDFFTAFRQLNTTGLILAHNAKNTTDGAKRSIYGNQYYTAQARNIWEVRKVQEADDDEIDIALFHRKAPPFDKLYPTLGFHIIFTKDTMKITTEKPSTIGEFAKAMSETTQIKKLLTEQGIMSIKDIATALGFTESNVRTNISRLKSKEIVTKIGDGYGMLAQKDLL